MYPNLDPTLDPDLVPVLGEFAWHSLTVDATLDAVSEEHHALLRRVLAEAGVPGSPATQILEVASYAHTTGYLLHQREGYSTTLCDISPSTLRLGRARAEALGLPTAGTTCVAGDFHDLPFDDGQFHAVYICSALHHTMRWERVVSELHRVLAPGGLLLLENEPCRRSFCHYAFRTNRPHSFGSLETALEQAGLLRTVAEPFWGTRAEALFGMVENQTIPLHGLVEAVKAQCDVLELEVSPEACMSDLEHAMVAQRERPVGQIDAWLREAVQARLARAAEALAPADRGMGFGLPDETAVADLCVRAAGALSALPGAGQAGFRLALADLFGAPVRLVARKRGVPAHAPAGRLKSAYPQADGVVLGFPPHVARLLDPARGLLPDLQRASSASIETALPPGDWAVGDMPGLGIRVATPRVAEPAIVLSAPGKGTLLVMLRVYAAFDASPWHLSLSVDGREVAGFDVHRTDSLLFTRLVPGGVSVRLSLAMKPLEAGGKAGAISLSYAGAHALDA